MNDPSTPEPRLAVAAVVVDAERLLLIRRGRAPQVGKWSLPGGRVEPGETLAEAVSREVLEETGIEVVPGDLVGWADRRDHEWHYVILDFAAVPALSVTDPVAGDDAAEAAWFPLAELGELQLVDGLRAWLVEHDVLPNGL
ncbi:MAG: NUDIX domain-containing protein [Acidimicrobiales bacterium]|jgi:mutator protein MutT